MNIDNFSSGSNNFIIDYEDNIQSFDNMNSFVIYLNENLIKFVSYDILYEIVKSLNLSFPIKLTSDIKNKIKGLAIMKDKDIENEGLN